MFKKIAFTAVGFAVLVSPLSVFAQQIILPSVSPNASVQDLENLIQQLTQILNQLLALRNTNASNATFDVSPKVGFSPLAVVFTSSSSGGSVDFGDGTSSTLSGRCTQSYPVSCSGTVSHTYAYPGTYKAKYYQQSCSLTGLYTSATCSQPSFGSATITVIDSAPNACQSYSVSVCPAGSHLVGEQVFGSCPVGGTCQSDSATSTSPTVCPTYQQPLCPAGEHNVNSGTTYNSNGCAVPNTSCVADSAILSCPNYTFPLCPTGQHNVITTTSFDANNCPVKTNSCLPN